MCALLKSLCFLCFLRRHDYVNLIRDLHVCLFDLGFNSATSNLVWKECSCGVCSMRISLSHWGFKVFISLRFWNFHFDKNWSSKLFLCIVESCAQLDICVPGCVQSNFAQGRSSTRKPCSIRLSWIHHFIFLITVSCFNLKKINKNLATILSKCIGT